MGFCEQYMQHWEQYMEHCDQDMGQFDQYMGRWDQYMGHLMYTRLRKEGQCEKLNRASIVSQVLDRKHAPKHTSCARR